MTTNFSQLHESERKEDPHHSPVSSSKCLSGISSGSASDLFIAEDDVDHNSDLLKNKPVSTEEAEILQQVQSLGFSALSRTKILENNDDDNEHSADYPLDIYIPSKNVAIEYNELDQHSEDKGKHRMYHYNKYLACKQAGIKLLQIWEDSYKKNPKLIRRVIEHKLNVNPRKVFARKTRFEKISNAEGGEFLDQHHLQGANRSAKHFGLRTKDSDAELIAVMSIRFNKTKKELEIKRFATKYSVPGGFSKLLKNSLLEHQKDNTTVNIFGAEYTGAERVVSYSHNDHSWGEVYQKNGFTKVHDGEPGYFYIRNGRREFRLNYSPKRFREREDLIFEEGLKERELATLNGLVRIWDSGSARWERAV